MARLTDNATRTTTARTLYDDYGAGVGIFDPTPVLWAADRAADKIGVAQAKAELKLINRFRDRAGLIVAVPAFGHRLF